jgi:uncharacterized protein YoxC
MTTMPLLLTIATGLALLILLGVLALALNRIANALRGIVGNLEKIAMGVRAIEKETGALIPGVAKLNQTFTGIADGFDSIEQSLQKLA